jgi:hypothetical protein
MTYKDVVDVTECSCADDVKPLLKKGWILEKIVQKVRKNHQYEEYGPCYILIKK